MSANWQLSGTMADGNTAISSLPGVPTLGGNTFAGVTFAVEQRHQRAGQILHGMGIERFPVVADVQRTQVPYSSDTIEQVGGRYAQPLEIPIMFRREDAATLAGLVGQTGTLTLLGDTPRTARLDKLDQLFDNPLYGIATAMATFFG